MDLLDQLAPLTTARPEIVSAVCAAWPQSQTIDHGKLKYDLHVLNNLGKVFEASQAVILTDNALLAFHLLNRPPKGLQSVFFSSSQHAVAARQHLAHPDGGSTALRFEVLDDSAVDTEADLLVVTDFEDVHNHGRAFELFVNSGSGSVLLIFSSLNAAVRSFCNRCVVTGRFEAAHFPTTRGLSVLQKTSQQSSRSQNGDQLLFDAWDELCAESEWTTSMEPRSRMIEEAAGWRDEDGRNRPTSVATAVAAIKSAARRVVAEQLPGPVDLSRKQKVTAFAARCSLLARQTSAHLASVLGGPASQSPSDRAMTVHQTARASAKLNVEQALGEVRTLIHADDQWRPLREILLGIFLERAREALGNVSAPKKSRRPRPAENNHDEDGADARQSEVRRANPRTLAMLARKLADLREIAFWTTNWDVKNNQTWKLLLEQSPPQRGLLPKPVKPALEYGGLYALQTIQRRDLRGQHAQTQPLIQPESGSVTAARKSGGINHAIRKEMVLTTIGILLRVLRRQFPNDTIRWLDLGCGGGQIVNGLQEPRDLGDNFEFVGLDYNQSNVDRATSKAGKNRRFYAGDALTPPPEVLAVPFHLVTAFEFMEHVLDPVTFVKSVLPNCRKYFLAGSPLAEKRSPKPPKAHVWSYERAGYEAIMEAADLEITYSAEIRVGSYVGGHDWLLVVGSRGPGLPRRLSLPRERGKRTKKTT